MIRLLSDCPHTIPCQMALRRILPYRCKGGALGMKSKSINAQKNHCCPGHGARTMSTFCITRIVSSAKYIVLRVHVGLTSSPVVECTVNNPAAVLALQTLQFERYIKLLFE